MKISSAEKFVGFFFPVYLSLNALSRIVRTHRRLEKRPIFCLFIKLAIVGLKQTGEDLLSLAAAVYSSCCLRPGSPTDAPELHWLQSTLPAPAGKRESRAQPPARTPRLGVQLDTASPQRVPAAPLASAQPHSTCSAEWGFTSRAGRDGMWDGMCQVQSFLPQVYGSWEESSGCDMPGNWKSTSRCCTLL